MKELYSLRKNCALAAMLFIACFTQIAQAETEIDNEYWISTSTNTENLGTLDNPFDGSTAAKFDKVMGSLPPNSTIHILAGTYQTYGARGYYIKSGDKVIGSGMDVTILQLVPNAPSDVWVLTDNSPDGGSTTNDEIADLTCDCNYQGGTFTYHGVGLNGPGMVVRRVKVVHMAYFDTKVNSESFGISIGGEGELIEDCEISEFAGGAVSAITISGNSATKGSGIIRNNRVYLPDVSDVGDAAQGINGSWTGNILIEGNYVSGASSAVYGDTGGCTNLLIAHNTFINCRNGVTFYGSQRRNITIAYNNIDLATNSAVAFSLWNGGNPEVSITNVIITGNTIDVDPQYSGTPFVIAAANVTGVLCYGNTINGILASNQVTEGATYFIDNKNLNFYNNYDLLGNLLTDFYEVPSTKPFNILPPGGAWVQWWGRGSVAVGQVTSLNGNEFIGWSCSGNANAAIFAALPSPADFFAGKTNYVTSWKLWTTNAGTFTFTSGILPVYTNGTSDLVQKTVSFTAPEGTNITTIAFTNTIPSASGADDLQVELYLAQQIQPGNYAILSGKVTAQ